MLPRVSAVIPLRPLSRLPLCSGGPEASAAAILLLDSLRGTVRYRISALLAPTENNIQRYFGTNNLVYSKKDEQSGPTCEISKETESKGSVKENSKKDLLNIIKGMKVELSTVNVQTTKPSNKRQLKNLETAIGRIKKAPEDTPQKRSESLSSELVAAVSAVADSLPFDRRMTKSELLRQLQKHEEDSRLRRMERSLKLGYFSNIISDMKVARSATARVSTRPVHQIQFDEGTDDFADQEKTLNLKKRTNDNIFKKKDIYMNFAYFECCYSAEAVPSLWDIEFAKQLAAVTERPFQNGFEEMIQWTKEGKLWEFPINNEAGFDDDGSEFHEHIFLDKYLQDFPKQGPIRHFMELVTCGLSKNPYLSVKQKVEHIEWFRNYFNEKRVILKESGIQLN
uniref:Small ribosomal subunit protein mS31 n=1 Tax=Sus scrofa TaxID=9823 RepID=A0A5G2QIS6_PIG